MTGLTSYTFRITWSAADSEWVATCDQMPSLSYLSSDPVVAAEWIFSLVSDLVDDEQAATVLDRP